MEKIFDQLYEFATNAGLKLLYAVLILIIGLRLISWLLKLLKRGKVINKLEGGARSFLLSCISIGLKILLLLTIASVLGIPTTSIVTMLASAGLAVGLALQGALGNFAGGFMILIFHPFKAGDFIEAGGYSGTVSEINVFYTLLITPDGKEITLPNGSLTNAAVVNYSAEPRRRVDLTFSASYSDDIEKVKRVLLETASKHELVLSDPAPFARLVKHNASSLDYVLRVWCESADYWTVNFDLNEAVKKAFDDEGISIPFPQLDVHSR